MALTILVFVLIGNTFWLGLAVSVLAAETESTMRASVYGTCAIAVLTAFNAGVGYLAYLIISNVGALS